MHAEELHLAELGIATLTSCFVNANRDPKSSPAKPKDFFYFDKPEGSDGVKISSSCANAFFSLVKDELMPAWVVALAPIEKLNAARNGDRVSKPRAWIGEGVLLLLPRVNEEKVEFTLGFVNEAVGSVEVRDVDAGVTFVLELPENGDSMWILDGEFNIIN